MGVSAVGLVAFFLELAGFVLVEAGVSVPTMWEVGASLSGMKILATFKIFTKWIKFALFLSLVL